MRLSLDRLPLLSALRTVSTHVPRSAPLELSAFRTGLQLTSVEDGSGVSYRLPAEAISVRAEGRAVVALTPALSILRSLDCGRVHLNGTAQYLSILRDGATSARSELPLLSPVAVPTLPPPTLTLTAGQLRQIVSRVAFAALRSPRADVVPLTGIHLELKGRRLELTATDGMHLATATLKVSESPRWCGIVPAAALRRWCDSDGSLSLGLGAGIVSFTNGDVQAWTTCLSGAFPRWKELATRERPNLLSVPAGELLARLQLALAVSERDEPIVQLDLAPGSASLSSDGEGRSIEEWPANYAGVPLSLSLPGTRLATYLGTLVAETVLRIELASAREPILCRVARQTGTYLLCPFTNDE